MTKNEQVKFIQLLRKLPPAKQKEIYFMTIGARLVASRDKD